MRLRVRYNHWLFRLPGMRRWNGLTLYPWILLRPARMEASERLLRHEYQHVVQVERMGWLAFYAAYLWQRLFKGYRDSRFEAEARCYENEPLTETQRERLGLP